MISAVSSDGIACRSRPRLWNRRVIGRSSGQASAVAVTGGTTGGACRALATASAQNVLGTRERISARQPDCEAERDLMAARRHPSGAAVDVDFRTRPGELVFTEGVEPRSEGEFDAAGELHAESAELVLLTRHRRDCRF